RRGEPKAALAAAAIERAMTQVIAQARALTPDLGGSASTQAMGDAVARAIDAVAQ
ncbi:MAG: isocitrate/isopropylmalate dehydrogenase family protein, partial [Proteobacteria bacterium]|nr:isocitrate/isopropylmalate dehydrogenase family protein [Burkholderiales bacterium]